MRKGLVPLLLRHARGGADMPFFGMSAPLCGRRGAYIPRTSVGAYAPPSPSSIGVRELDRADLAKDPRPQIGPALC